MAARWDLLVRVSHWGIAAVVIGNALITEGGGTIHVTLGWIGAGLLALRLVWGVIGRAEARFSAFPPAPSRALAHLGEVLRGQPRDCPSHNPAGAMMIYALWLSLAIVIGTGLAMTGAEAPWTRAARQEIVETGDWSQLVTDEESGSGALKEVHEIVANLMLVLAVIHVAGVAVESRLLRRNLVRPMVTGRS